MKKIFKNLEPFTINEKLKIISFKILKKFIRIRSTNLIRKYSFITKLINNNIDYNFKENYLSFNYLINNKNFKFKLLKVSSDIDVFDQIILEEEYKAIIRICSDNNIVLNNVIDAGANIGLVTLYLKAFFPLANIISLEPSNDTFLRLKNNIEQNNLKNIFMLNEGVWSTSTMLYGDFSFGDGRDWAFSLRENKNSKKNTIPVNSIKDLMLKNNYKTIDFIKIDIEGGEQELFKESSDISWLKMVKLIAIEIHDELGIRNSIENKIKQQNFSITHSGELTIGLNLSPSNKVI